MTLIWEDGAIRNCWLQVTVLATDATGLTENQVFYVGNALGESGNSTADALVNATDEIAHATTLIRRSVLHRKTITTTTIATSWSTRPIRSSPETTAPVRSPC